MRLTHIKLAGFKSFVEPTHIPVPGQLVGVVGPNGCGKSNVIDAVRWVLGETSAKQLRGENMQDVIFAGSSERKPMSRASVELIFDNSLGRAAGAWSQYAEISVKRVLERDGASSYYLNNQHVRRRDVADIFLGTGLGGRGYAIIEQGMISRIIEARPDDMRAFLEEAAGVSKYKERRRETELRLEDTRENLARVEDIRSELDKQLRKLEQQSKQAERFRQLEAELKDTQQNVWFFSKASAEKKRLEIEESARENRLEIDRTVAQLTEAESMLQTLKVSRDESASNVNDVQGHLYQASSEIARIEQTIEHLRDTRERINQQIRSVKTSRAQHRENLTQLERAFWSSREAALDSKMNVSLCVRAIETLREHTPSIEASFQEAKLRVDAATEQLSQSKSQLAIHNTHLDHGQSALEQLNRRKERLSQERGELVPEDQRVIESMNTSIQSLEQEVANREGVLTQEESRLHELEVERDTVSLELDEAKKRQAELAAQHQALVDLQQRVSRSQDLDEWLLPFTQSGSKRLWEVLKVASGFEDAVEAVLRERLMSVPTDSFEAITLDSYGVPPSKVSFYQKGFKALMKLGSPSGFTSLASVIETEEETVKELIDQWLSHVFILPEGGAVSDAVSRLKAGELIVSKRGDLYYPGGVVIFAPDQEVHGVLARQQEIEDLGQQIAESKLDLDQSAAQVTQLNDAISELRRSMATHRHDQNSQKEQLHRERVEFLRLSDLTQRTVERLAQIDEELLDIDSHEIHEQKRVAKANDDINTINEAILVLTDAFQESEELLLAATTKRDLHRSEIDSLEKQKQEHIFSERSNLLKINDLGESIKAIYDAFIRMDGEYDSLYSQLDDLVEADSSAELQAALSQRRQVEQELTGARQVLSDWEQKIREKDEARLSLDRALQPLREALNQHNLNEQEQRIARDTFTQYLTDANADLEQLAKNYDESLDLQNSQTQIETLQRQINNLGAVNLAAFDELGEAAERKSYLDSQAEDLTTAVETLENAIKSIDKETRERLNDTFDKVNEQFGTMFPALFGGGEAKLVLSGEEILDAGVEVIARPPGKRNASIHLLSGGEKALTALSLVFSLFQLNPAPFCLLDEVDAPLDDSNTTRYCELVKKMSGSTQFLFITHNKITMELAEQLVGVTMQEQGVSRVVAVDVDEALKMNEQAA